MYFYNSVARCKMKSSIVTQYDNRKPDKITRLFYSVEILYGHYYTQFEILTNGRKRLTDYQRFKMH